MTAPLLHDSQHIVWRIACLLDGEGKAPSLADLAAATGLSPYRVQRLFVRATGLSPAVFARLLREERAERALAQGGRITDVLYDAGFESPARFYAAMQIRLGMTPSAWRRGGAGVRIGWIIQPTSLGPMLLAVTDKGVCRLAFNEGAAQLADRFPAAELVPGAVPRIILERVLHAVERPDGNQDIALDVAGTPFQQRVWAHLRTIPPGETRSYAEVAIAVGKPGAARAVGGASASNPVAVLIPCHRVIATDGSLGGYAWGERIKRELLSRERPA